MKLDSIIIASHLITPDLKLSEESKKRIEKGLDLLYKGLADFLIMNGGPGQYTKPVNGSKFVNRFSNIPRHCDLMKEYALKLGADKNKILVQNYSSDTIGEAFFVKAFILEPNCFTNNFLVTSNYHILRSSIIYDYILGEKYFTVYVSTDVPKQKVKIEINKEFKKIKKFFDFVKCINKGDSYKFQQKLYESHELYNKIPLERRILIYK